MTGHRLHSSILREYDVRGTVGEALTEADAEPLGCAFATWLTARGGKSARVGRDGRILETALTKGLLAGGVDVIRIGMEPAPMLCYATVTRTRTPG